MKLSARSRYAARILLELARHKAGTPMSAAVLSQHTGVSVQFVEQILKPLKQKGLTNSVRGAAGGHRLAQDRGGAAQPRGEIERAHRAGLVAAELGEAFHELGRAFAGDTCPIGMQGGQACAFGIAFHGAALGMGQMLGQPTLALGQGLWMGGHDFDAVQ